jgi:hypothetical protein
LLADAARLGQIDLTTTDFEKVKLHIRDDPRYERIDSHDRRTVFDRFMRELKRNAFQSFRELLVESKNIGHITSKTPTSGTKFENLKNLLKVKIFND